MKSEDKRNANIIYSTQSAMKKNIKHKLLIFIGIPEYRIKGKYCILKIF